MKILLSVTGGIAAYKAIDLTSKLVQRNHEVKVMMTPSAREFITPLPFQALSRHEVHSDIFDETEPDVIKHIDLADWADVNIIAPATASTIGKLAHGIADNMVTTTLIASTKPTFIAPAMNSNMYSHPAVQENIRKLSAMGYHFIDPGSGFLACGYIAKGRMSEPLDIIRAVEAFQVAKQYQNDLKGKKILVTAGPTIERIDAVRYLTNNSSGRMGYAIAEAAQLRGADVTLVSGPVQLEVPNNVRFIQVESAAEMFDAVTKRMDQDIIIKAAAVADYTTERQHGKIKKKDEDLTLTLQRTQDILKYLGEHKTTQYLAGFAAETEQVEMYARGKLAKKNADVIIANNVGDSSIGFKSDQNAVEMFFRNGMSRKIGKMPKRELAHEILTAIKQDIHVR
ncbi:bifunctional phosphopantothenoylcysteine decarboxylase/phosphopantothenate--cysteine ligase CoaBC [Macrococcus bovicus]|uniref:bifunctional phosphopantothenoylcysteine decarboxylase/phosphopantothenate--cysteine ligase CoaBC n=1 Tax=Macrococcus bovicus TaxID=69968 RepID=UPI0025A54077|nr:bifunctional phosphopantothenoylcysteine decarboxylase/phosphopantothenate--cysteine ligase CoaBC [Macrococcus bovicus]WJP98617.1 bifunctional phosphopantothenoylcysteine decarboxylase/phosphopantothenate--cysteine ligase CoaBC [Macrococcus bovicus]